MSNAQAIKSPNSLTLEQLCFDNKYAALPSEFFSRHSAEPLTNQYLAHFNHSVAELLNLNPDQAQRQDFLDLFTGKSNWPGTMPIAMCYAGHQFGQYVPRLGDGRALLLGQVIDQNKQLWDLQLKGSGRTLYSRQGDGRAVLRSTIREYLGSAAMSGLGIPTTLGLAIFGSDEHVYRQSIETGAMLVRMAPSHIRFGSFEYFFYRHQYDDLKILADYVINNYFESVREMESPYLELLKTVISRTAKLVAQWQSVGFCHGVMNSDNMSIHGITIDYGPFGFLDSYQSNHICNHSDHSGRYAFNRQPSIGLFNLSCFAQALLPLLNEDPDIAVDLATAALKNYQRLFKDAHLKLKRKKLGLESKLDEDDKLYDDLLFQMEQHKLDFTNTFRNLSRPSASLLSTDQVDLNTIRSTPWLKSYLDRLSLEDRQDDRRVALMQATNPKYILRNYMAENAIRNASDSDDFTELDKQMTLLENPFSDQPDNEHYSNSPPDWSRTLSVSCSS